MGNEERIRLVVEAQNRANPVLQAVGRGLDTMAKNAKSAGTSASQAATTVRTAMSNVGAVVTRTSAAFMAFSRSAHSSLSSILTPLGALTRGLSSIGGVLGGLSIAAFTKAGIDMNLTVDRATAALTKMTGSATVASRFVEALRKEAETSAPTLAELLPIAQQLAAAYGNQGLGKVIPTIRAFGDAAVSLGAGTDGMQLALLGFRQLLGRDFPQQEELNQVRENLPGLDVNGILKRSFGSADTEVLKDAGVTGQMVGDALVRGMQQAFGGAQAQGAMKLPTLLSNFQDTFSRAAGNITLGLLRALEGANGAVTRLLGSFQKLTEGSGFMGAMTVIFDGLGRAMDMVATQGDRFVGWLDAVFSREGVVLMLSNILGLVGALGQAIGVDLRGAMDPNVVGAFFNAIGEGVTAAINGFFGMGRVMDEVVRIGKSAFQDMGDAVRDHTVDIMLGFKALFYGLQIQIMDTTQAMLMNLSLVMRSVATTLDAMGALGFNNPITGKRVQFFPGVSGDALRGAAEGAETGYYNTGKARMALLGQQEREVTFAREEEGRFRGQRANRRLGEDRFRNDPFGQRIADAFAGTNRDMSAQDIFWSNFEGNRLAIQQALFAGTAAPAMPSFPGAPSLYGGGGMGRGVSLGQQAPMIPSLPDSMRPDYGNLSTDAYIRQRDSGFQYGSMYGGGTFNVNVHATITREGMIAAAEEAYEELVRRGIAGPSGF